MTTEEEVPQQQAAGLVKLNELINTHQQSNTNSSSSSSLTNLYNKAAHLFINRKFNESFEIVHSWLDKVIDGVNDNSLPPSLFINYWSLYLNLFDIFINNPSTITAVDSSTPQGDVLLKAEQLFYSDSLFSKIDRLHLLAPIYVNLLLAVYLKSEKGNNSKLKGAVDVFLNVFKSYIENGISLDQSEYQKLLEIYYLELLPKTDLTTNEINYLIWSDVSLEEGAAQAYSDKLKELAEQQKLKLEEIKLKQEEERKKEEQRRKQMVQKQEKTIQAASTPPPPPPYNPSQSQPQQSLIQLLKSNFLKKLSQNNSLFSILTIISLLFVLSKNTKLTRLLSRPILSQIWLKFQKTIEMAFKVTYI